MKFYNIDRFKPIEIALKMVGLRVVCLEQNRKKTIITVTRYKGPGRRHLSAIRGF